MGDPDTDILATYLDQFKGVFTSTSMLILVSSNGKTQITNLDAEGGFHLDPYLTTHGKWQLDRSAPIVTGFSKSGEPIHAEQPPRPQGTKLGFTGPSSSTVDVGRGNTTPAVVPKP